MKKILIFSMIFVMSLISLISLVNAQNETKIISTDKCSYEGTCHQIKDTYVTYQVQSEPYHEWNSPKNLTDKWQEVIYNMSINKNGEYALRYTWYGNRYSIDDINYQYTFSGKVLTTSGILPISKNGKATFNNFQVEIGKIEGYSYTLEFDNETNTTYNISNPIISWKPFNNITLTTTTIGLIDGMLNGIESIIEDLGLIDFDLTPPEDFISTDDTTQSACGTITISDVYTFNQSITSLGNCMVIEANNVTLNCMNYNINFSTTTSGVGINITGNNTIIKNCNIQAINQTFSIILGGRTKGILIKDRGNITIQNNQIKINSTGSPKLIHSLNGQEVTNIINNTFYNLRGTGTAIFYDGSSSATGNNKEVIIDKNTFYYAGDGINTYNYVVNNTITNNVFNSLEWAGQTTIYWDYYAITTYVGLANSSLLMTNNSINTSGFGIFLEAGTNKPITLINNSIYTHRGIAIVMGDEAGVLNYKSTIIGEDNLAHNKPIKYYWNVSSQIIQNNNSWGELILVNSNNATIQNITLNYDGMMLGTLNNVSIKNSLINKTTSMGIYGSSLIDGGVYNSQIINTTNQAIYGMSGATYRNFAIVNNNLSGYNTYSALIYATAMSKMNISNNFLESNDTIINIGGSGTTINNKIIKNTFILYGTYSNPVGTAIQSLSDSGDLVQDNIISGVMSYGFYGNGLNRRIIGNTFNIIGTKASANVMGVYDYLDSNGVVSNNNISIGGGAGVGTAIGIYCQQNPNSTIIGNNIFINYSSSTGTQTGIFIWLAQNVSIINNFINVTTATGSYGILLGDNQNTTTQFSNNKIYSLNAVWLGQVGVGAKKFASANFTNDVFVSRTSKSIASAEIYLNTNGTIILNNVTFNKSNVWINNPNTFTNLTVNYLTQVYVHNLQNRGLNYSEVNITDNNSISRFSGVTNSLGYSTTSLQTEYIALANYNYNSTCIGMNNLICYNPYFFNITKNGLENSSYKNITSSQIWDWSLNIVLDSCTSPAINNNWIINLKDFCILTINTILGTGNITYNVNPIGDGNFTLIANLTANTINTNGTSNTTQQIVYNPIAIINRTGR